MKESLNLVWLRRDLRLGDHAALASALKHRGAVQPIFIFDTDILARFANRHDRRLPFIADALAEMHLQLAAQGGGLLVLHGRPQEIVPRLAQILEAGQVFAAKDIEPGAQVRDAMVAKQVKLHLVKDHLIFFPDEILKDDGTPYRVFTPYSNAWRKRANVDSFAAHEVKLQGRLAPFASLRQQAASAGLPVLDAAAGSAAMLEAVGYTYTKDTVWKAGEGRARLHQFIDRKIKHYATGRDMLAEDGTSTMSPYLRFGLISVRECARLASEQHVPGAEKWISELIWRDFYAMILFHYPDSATQEWQEGLRGKIPWSNDAALKEAFFAGRTGYPIVDAAMRQLLREGWMHNRARMIVASFATKDLLLDWRAGEEHFAQMLMDYDMASNVGGWQWAASTGTDAQPWFRIFNPLLQSQKFDPKGDYIRTYVPEIAHLNAKDIHEAHKHLPPSRYPYPIIDHAAARTRTLAVFKGISD